MAAEPIQVDPADDVPAIIERIRRSSAVEVHLVVPPRARFGQSRFNFQLLKQYATRLGKRVAIVSPDPAVQRLAEESGLGALRVVERGGPAGAPQAWPPSMPAGAAPPAAGRRQAPLAPPGGGLPQGAGVPAGDPLRLRASGASGPALGPAAGAPGLGQAAASARAGAGPPGALGRGAIASRLGSLGWIARPGRAGAARQLGARIRIAAPQRLPAGLKMQLDSARTLAYAAVALIGLGLLTAMAYFVPSAQVTLIAQAQPFSANADVSAQPGSGAIHVRYVTVDKRASTSGTSTGTKVSGGQVATGTFTYMNACPQALTIPNGQRLQGPGVMFAQLGDVKVDPGASDTGSIKAVQPGQNGNVQAGQITSLVPNPYANCLTGTNQQPTQGGSDGQKSTVIQSSDLQSVRAVLEQQLRQQILDELNRGVQKGEKLVAQPIFATEDFNPDHQADDQVPSFTATLHLVAEGDYYSPDDVTMAYAAILRSKVAASQQLTTDRV